MCCIKLGFIYIALLLSISFSQDSLYNNIYNEKSIYLKHSIFMNKVKYIQGEQENSAGFYYSALPILFKNIPSSFKLTKSGIKDYKIGLVCQLVGVGAGAFFLFNSKDKPGNAIIGVGTFFLGSILNIHFSISGRNKIDKAVWEYNRHILKN